MKKLAALFFFFLPEAFAQSAESEFARQIEGEIELAGFLLGQHKNAVYKQLGPPFQRSLKKDGWLYEFHNLKPDTSVYALFKYQPADTSRIYSIEVVGDRFDEMHPFRGLKLGSPKEKVTATLGAPSRTETIVDPPVVTQYYANKNYSVDIDDRGRLYGIQVFGSILDHKPTADPSIKGFKNAILTKNIDSLIQWVSPDLQLHRGGKINTFTVSARNELNNKNSELAKYLFGETNSVWYAFAKEYAEGTSESRLHPHLNQMTMVDKFFDSSTISEVVFRTHAGKWKVYEIFFR